MGAPEEGRLIEEIEKWREAIKETVEIIISLCPAYNRLVQRLMAIEGVRTSVAARLYPDLFHPDGVKIFSELLGIELGKEVKLSHEGIARKLVDFAKIVEEVFENEEVRKILEETIGLRLEKTPRRSYVEACVEALKDDKIALAALKVLAERGSRIRYETELIPTIKEKYGIECTKEDLIDSLGKTANLKLLDIFTENEAMVSYRYARYLSEVIRL